MKVCTECGETKPRSEFHKRAASSDGLQFVCKPCNNLRAARSRCLGPEDRYRRFWEAIRSGPAVQVRTEDELRMALNDPYPFYAEPS